VSDENEVYVQLKLHDFKIIDQFICYSEHGMDAEPAHRVLVNAKGDYDHRSDDKLELNGQQISLDQIQITAVSTKEDCLKNHARLSHITIRMIDHVFSPFVELLRSNTQTDEMLIKLRARPSKEYPDMLWLSFDGIDLTRNAGVEIGDQTLAREERLVAGLNTIKKLLSAIAVMTGLVLLHIIFR